MAELTTADGVKLSWRERGTGPDVLLVPYWGVHPSVFEPLTRELERDHRVIAYDDRGTGASDRAGPFDMETSAADLLAVCGEAAVDHAVAICLVDAGNRAARVASRSPELIADVVCVGGAPLTLASFDTSEAMIASDTVVGAFRQMIETDFRGAMRSMLADTNSNLSEEELRERVRVQVEYSPQGPTVARMEAWSEDEDGVEIARSLGPRLRVLLSPGAGGGWFPDVHELRRVIERTLPEARVGTVADGIVSAPEATAAAVRELLAARDYDRSA